MHHLDQEGDYPLSNRLLLYEPFDFRMLISLGQVRQRKIYTILQKMTKKNFAQCITIAVLVLAILTLKVQTLSRSTFINGTDSTSNDFYADNQTGPQMDQIWTALTDPVFSKTDFYLFGLFSFHNLTLLV